MRMKTIHRKLFFSLKFGLTKIQLKVNGLRDIINVNISMKKKLFTFSGDNIGVLKRKNNKYINLTWWYVLIRVKSSSELDLITLFIKFPNAKNMIFWLLNEISRRLCHLGKNIKTLSINVVFRRICLGGWISGVSSDNIRGFGKKPFKINNLFPVLNFTGKIAGSGESGSKCEYLPSNFLII